MKIYYVNEDICEQDIHELAIGDFCIVNKEDGIYLYTISTTIKGVDDIESLPCVRFADALSEAFDNCTLINFDGITARTGNADLLELLCDNCTVIEVHKLLTNAQNILDNREDQWKSNILIEIHKKLLSNTVVQTEDPSKADNSTTNDVAKSLNEKGANAKSQGKYDVAFALFEEAANLGSSDGQYNLANCYEMGYGCNIDTNKAISLYKPLTESGNKDAQYRLGSIYLSNNYYDEAFSLLKKAADQNKVNAFPKLGKCYLLGLGVDKEEERAFDLFRKSETCPESQYYIGYCYYYGLSVDKDSEIAKQWLNKAAENHYENAKLLLQEISKAESKKRIQGFALYYFQKAKESEKNNDLIKALELYKKAAGAGNTDAQNSLAICYKYGKGCKKNVEKAIYWYETAAKAGNIYAMTNLAISYYYGDGIDKDYKKAYKLCQTAASLGNAAAQNLLGICFEHGNGTKKDLTLAHKWYEKAANAGNSYAQYILGLWYKNGKVVKEDWTKAFRLFLKAAEQGDEDAQYEVGTAYLEGLGINKNYDNAFVWLSKAVENDCDNAKPKLGRCFLFGLGTERNVKEAYKLFEESDSDAESKYYLAYCHFYGLGVDKDYDKAKVLLKEAEDNGFEDTSDLYNKIENDEKIEKSKNGPLFYSKANEFENKRELAKAFEFYEKSAETGFPDAQNRLAIFYKLGKGCKKNLKKAAYWFEKSANAGNVYAMAYLSECYYLGEGIGKDMSKAFYFSNKSAKSGIPISQNVLGQCYENGFGIEKDTTIAYEWYKKAAEKNHVLAQYNLGRCYENGIGVDSDISLAIPLYKKAAEQGNKDSQYRLGNAYLEGAGVEKNYEIAISWLNKASDQGFYDAKCKLGKLYLTGEVVEKDEKKAYRLFEESGSLPESQYYLGYCNFYGIGTVKNIDTAKAWINQAIKRNNEKAINLLPKINEEEESLKQQLLLQKAQQQKLEEKAKLQQEKEKKASSDYNEACLAERNNDLSKAFELYKKSAESGNSDAQNSLAICYRNGKGCPKDDSKAIYWYELSSNAGNVYAMSNLGWFYYNGVGVKQDYNKAFSLCKQAAENGITSSQNILGLCYEHGYGVEKNVKSALEWYKKAAEKGNKYAQYNLSLYYENGIGGTIDLQTAKEWLDKAIENGHIIAKEHEQILLRKIEDCRASNKIKETIDTINSSFSYKTWKSIYGKNKSYKNINPMDILKEYSDNGYIEAQKAIGQIYKEGKWDGYKREEAFRYFRLAADQGDTDSQFEVGEYLYNTSYNYYANEEGLKYLQMAADKGYVKALLKLGEIYSGLNDYHSYEKARKYYKQAMRTESKDAEEKLHEIENLVDCKGLIYKFESSSFSLYSAYETEREEYSIPATIEYNGSRYSVRNIDSYALKNLRFLKRLVLEYPIENTKWRILSNTLEIVKLTSGDVIYDRNSLRRLCVTIIVVAVILCLAITAN